MNLGHGTFFYLPDETAAAYGSLDAAVAATATLGMRHAWVRAHGGIDLMPMGPTAALIDRLTDAGIDVAIWGWCDGNDLDRDLGHVRRSFEVFGVRDYVADIEHEVRGARWSADGVRAFLEEVRDLQGPGKRLIVSTFGIISDHGPELIEAAAPCVDGFAPQCYWHRDPVRSMLSLPGARPDGYPLDNAAGYVSLCIDLWRHITDKPLVITGQAYWGEKPGFEEPQACEKLEQFLQGFGRWQDIAGLNWWHLGGNQAMSPRMFDALRRARLDRHLDIANAPAGPLDLSGANSPRHDT